MRYCLGAVCRAAHESEVRHALLNAIAERPLALWQLRAEDLDEGEEVSIRADVESSARDSDLTEETADALRADPDVTAVNLAEGTLDSA